LRVPDGRWLAIPRYGKLAAPATSRIPVHFPIVPFELFIGLRYTRAKRRNHFISIISLISMLGIALGVGALIVVLSVMNGFQKEVRDRMLAVVSHIQISGADGVLADWEKTAAEAARNSEVVASAPYVSGQGVLSYGGGARFALVRGILPQREVGVTDLAQQIKLGSLEALRPGEFNIILGVDLARAIGAGIGDKILLISPEGQMTPAGMVPRLKQFTLVAIFEAGHFEYDSGLALMHIEDAQKLYRLGDKVSGVRLKLKDLFAAQHVAQELQESLSGDVFVADWSRQNRNWFLAVKTEKRMMFIILALIIAVAAFNIVSTLVMAVTDKQADIAILRTLGASPLSITKIFIVQGALIGVIGTLLGVGGGILLTLNLDTVVSAVEHLFGVQFLSKDIYFITNMPTDLRAADVTAIGAVSLFLGLAATLYPSWRAAKINPADALRYE
jgi:lipoprotein-releasing system permease protein